MKSTYLKRNGHERYRVVKKGRGYASVSRRMGAKERLEKQLRSSTKPFKGDGIPSEDGTVLLSPEDRKRIEKEIKILNSRI